MVAENGKMAEVILLLSVIQYTFFVVTVNWHIFMEIVAKLKQGYHFFWTTLYTGWPKK